MTRTDLGPRLLIVGVMLIAAAVAVYAFEDEPRRSMLAAAPAPTIDVHFSPRGGCTEAVVGLIGSARHRVRVQAYSFTSRPIADALIAAHRRGVDVSIVLDGGQRTAPGSLGHECGAAGVPVTYDAAHAIAHNKLVMVDGRAVALGSFNLTLSAEERNAENLAVIRDRQTAATYEANWVEHRGHSKP